MLKYNITLSDTLIDITVKPALNPIHKKQKERQIEVMNQRIAEAKEAEVHGRSPNIVITEEVGGAEAKSFAQADNNDALVSELDLRQRAIRFEGQIERAKELLGKRGLNASAMHYILTGEKQTRRAAGGARKKR